MSPYLKLFATAVAAGVTVAVSGGFVIRKINERKIVESKSRIEAYRRAYDFVMKKAQNGDYNNATSAQIQEDYKFALIVAQLED